MTPDEPPDGALFPAPAPVMTAEAVRRAHGVVVCMTRCYACQFGEHQDPPAWHSWADPDDVEHCKATGQPDPSDKRCGCSCADIERPAHEMPAEVTTCTDPWCDLWAPDATGKCQDHAVTPSPSGAVEKHATPPAGPQPCDVCGINVTANVIERTGHARHPWHDAKRQP